MAYSGTISQTVFDTRRVIEHATRRCKMSAQTLSAEHVDVANDVLYLLLSDLANQGAPLWCIERQIYPLYEGVGSVVLDVGTVDILNSNLRSLQTVQGMTTTVTATEQMYEFEDETMVNTVGIKWASASVPVSFERSDDGLTWTVVQTETPDAAAGEWTWYDLSTGIASLFFRVQATSGSLDFDEIYLGNMPTEIPLARLNKDDYTNLPNKTFQSSRPLQYWYDRLVPQPIMRLWPVPNASAETSQIVLWRQRQIMDVGTMTQEIEVPQRWYEAIVSMLAAKLAMEFVEVDPAMIEMLDAKAERALYIAQQEERDNSPINIAPNISAYTR